MNTNYIRELLCRLDEISGQERLLCDLYMLHSDTQEDISDRLAYRRKCVEKEIKRAVEV